MPGTVLSALKNIYPLENLKLNCSVLKTNFLFRDADQPGKAVSDAVSLQNLWLAGPNKLGKLLY